MTPEEFKKEIIPEGKRLYTFAFRYLNIREEAEDIVQDIMTKLWEERETLNDYANVRALATTMTRNMCIDRIRKKKTVRIDDKDIQNIVGDMEEMTGLFNEREEASSLAKRIIYKLKEPYKSAVILRDIEGYSYEEAAQVLEMNVNALRTVLSRARKSIRDEIVTIYSYGTGKDKGTAKQVL